MGDFDRLIFDALEGIRIFGFHLFLELITGSVGIFVLFVVLGVAGLFNDHLDGADIGTELSLLGDIVGVKTYVNLMLYPFSYKHIHRLMWIMLITKA